MRQSKWAPSIIPEGEDHNVYLVVDDFGYNGRCWRETDVETTDLETVITDLLASQYNNPVRVVGFNWQRAGRVIYRKRSPTKFAAAAICEPGGVLFWAERRRKISACIYS